MQYSFGFMLGLMLCAISLMAQQNEADTLNFKQDFSQEKVLSWLEIGGSGNAFRGDLNTQMRFWQPALHIAIQLNRKRQWNGKFAFNLGSIRAENPLYEYPLLENPPATPNTYFKTTFFSLHYELHYNFIKTRKFLLYIAQGIGFFRFQVKDINGQDLVSNSNTRKQGENYSTNALMLPTSAGVAYILPNGWGLQGQVGLYNTRTDYLDNISAWGTLPNNDNIFQLKLSALVPLSKQPLRKPRIQKLHTH